MNPRGILSRIFLSPDERRLRAGWRLVVQLLLLATLSLVFGLLWSIGRIAAGQQPALSMSASEVVTTLSITVSVFLGRRWLDRRSLASLGLRLNRRAWLDLLAGFGVGAAIMGLIFLLACLAGWATVSTLAWQKLDAGQIALSLGANLVVFVAVGWQEELYFRGYLLQNLRDGLNLVWAVVISSLIFGAVHLGNPNSLAMSMVGISLAGILMAFGYFRTRQLWLPIGLHIAWNFFEGPVFGFPVSGLSTFHLIQVHVSGPTLITGGAFGPEAGLILLPALALGALLIGVYSAKL